MGEKLYSTRPKITRLNPSHGGPEVLTSIAMNTALKAVAPLMDVLGPSL